MRENAAGGNAGQSEPGPRTGDGRGMTPGGMTPGGAISLAGTVIGLLGMVPLAPVLAAGLTPRSLGSVGVRGLPALSGLLIFLVGTFVYVLQPAIDPRMARRVPIATIRNVLAMLIVITVLANLASLPYLRLAMSGGARPVAQAPPGGAAGLAYLIVASELPILLLVWVRLLLPGCLAWASFGFTFKRLGELIGDGILGGVSVFVVAGIVGAALSRAGIRQNQALRFEGVQGAPIGLFVLALLAGCVLAPIAEELFFRGYVVQTFLRER
ncbi:MAG: CPBP family glutamic-type intramembrane protease, partial [Chloroflexota bacterium]